MIFNWNNNDTKYIVKKIIILLCGLIAITIFTTWKANAAIIEKPGNVQTYIWNNPNDHTQGSSVLTKYGSAITDLVPIGDDLEQDDLQSYFMGQYWDIFQYNTTNRFNGQYLWVDTPKVSTTQIWEFTYGFDVKTLGDTNDLEITKIIASVTKNGTTTYPECGIVARQLTQRTTTQSTALYRVRCVLDATPNNVFIEFQPYANTVWDRKFWFLKNSTIRNPISNEELAEIQEQIAQGIEYQNGIIENAATNNANNSFTNNFFNNPLFSDNTGLQSVITLPLNMVNNLSNTCTPITLTIPYINGNVTLPCMSTIYQTHFNGIYILISLVINGFFIYRILIKIYQLVHDAKDPAQDKLEVVDL